MFNTCVYRWLGFASLLAFVLTFTSCFNSRKAHRELTYLQGNLDTLPNLNVPVKEVSIQKGDLLSIVIYSDNPAATSLYNQQQVSLPSSSSSSPGSTSNLTTNGYLVDQKGNIYFQSLGSIHVEGLTLQELSKLLAEKLGSVLQNPFANVRFLNFKFTVLGEVNHPGTFSVPDEKVSVLEMLGLAGDLTLYGRRDNILIIREQDGKREFGRLDLRKNDIFQSPYFYLRQNDVVVVEANSRKATLNDQTTLRNLSIITGFASVISITAVLINTFRK